MEFSCNNYILIDIDITKCCDNPSSIFTNRFNKCICFINNRCSCVNICCFFLTFLFCCSIILLFLLQVPLFQLFLVWYRSFLLLLLHHYLRHKQLTSPTLIMQLKNAFKFMFFPPSYSYIYLMLFCTYIVVIYTFYQKKKIQLLKKSHLLF
jgi:hypothetical protein